MKINNQYGPFVFKHIHIKKESVHYIDIHLKAWDNSSFGWEWGYDGYESCLPTLFRLFNLNLFGFKWFKSGGFEIWLLGFWYVS